MRWILRLLIFFLSAWRWGLEGQTPRRTLCVMEYNVENLFDTEDDPNHADEDFLPDGSHHWTPARYRLKLQRIAEVISLVGDEDFPDLVGLVEVEGGQVIEDLLHKTPLGQQAGYSFLVTHGEDPRGIQVALLYRPSSFRLIAKEEIPLHFPFDEAKRTRSLLHATGVVASGDTLDVVLCHLPSRRGGARRTAPYRAYAAGCLRRLADSLAQVGGGSRHSLLLGDFNGEAEEPFIAEVLGAQPYVSSELTSVQSDKLYALLHRESPNKRAGSYCYQGCWSQLDQLIVSSSLLRPSSSLCYVEGSAETIQHPAYTTERGTPWRTYGGAFYQGGYSDHFPIRLHLSY